MPRYTVSRHAGQRDGKCHAVLDHHDRQGGKGIRRVSFHRTAEEAKAEARRLNEVHEDLNATRQQLGLRSVTGEAL